MARVKLDQQAFGLSRVMERITGARVKDVFSDSQGVVHFIVAQGHLGKAVGKGGSIIKKVQSELGKRVKVVEFNDDIKKFVENFIHPISVQEIVLEGEDLILKDESKKTKSLLIGRDGKNLQLLNRAVKRFFPINEVKVV